jgi:hypothetical protein
MFGAKSIGPDLTADAGAVFQEIYGKLVGVRAGLDPAQFCQWFPDDPMCRK